MEDLEQKVREAVSEMFSRLHNAFEENGLELSYEIDDYVEELILKEIPDEEEDEEEKG